VVLAAAAGTTNSAIGADLGVSVDTVRKWRKRFAEKGDAWVGGASRSGRPRRLTPVQVAAIEPSNGWWRRW